MNYCFITGRLVKDPVLTKTVKGTPNCQFSLAVNRPVIRDGKKEVDFINCIVWNKMAESLTKYQKKGNLLGIQGQFRTDTYEKNGEKKYKSYILVEDVEFLDYKRDNNVDNKEMKDITAKTETQETISYSDDDLPW